MYIVTRIFIVELVGTEINIINVPIVVVGRYKDRYIKWSVKPTCCTICYREFFFIPLEETTRQHNILHMYTPGQYLGGRGGLSTLLGLLYYGADSENFEHPPPLNKILDTWPGILISTYNSLRKYICII